MSQSPAFADPASAVLLVLTTVATRAQADALARALVQRRLAACAQISAIDSVYEWQGQLHAEAEQRLLLKTSAARYADLCAALRELHPYTLPAIVALPCAHAEAAFADWVRAQTQPPAA